MGLVSVIRGVILKLRVRNVWKVLDLDSRIFGLYKYFPSVLCFILDHFMKFVEICFALHDYNKGFFVTENRERVNPCRFLFLHPGDNSSFV